MPIYEYECLKCHKVFEVMQKMSDPPPKRHTCGSTRIRRLLSQSSFVLKGTGWYITDYGRKDKGGGNNKEGGGSSSTKPSDNKSSGPGSGTDKSAAKPASTPASAS